MNFTISQHLILHRGKKLKGTKRKNREVTYRHYCCFIDKISNISSRITNSAKNKLNKRTCSLGNHYKKVKNKYC